ncbi:GerMN domain-containing protein [Arthrobacter sp. zg-Y820]|uniref:GerMN domain-containing protein n=1 Tax=unclassified Arthrobacter TaxID=235627 RepID=UPI001E33FBF7|nr:MULTISPECIES: GerMN domain-containing protein [unclassified Arthrobacter]MCC9196481.1 GerMN domain-containing protein [Arthrobacter sp. zg-Y820]MDK1279343.1 GerMN domain-containing protein [Arthrobacter sp. zg.Y820]MDK1359037.1 GerMN domain-containing protein [Arthrobacter sp. zg-Y1219]WIB08271.1 GerMN domain-containing protein [Arthrobacter sp. zg-Y820]
MGTSRQTTLRSRRGFLGLLAASSLLLSGCGVVAVTPTTTMPISFGAAGGSVASPLSGAAPSEGKPAPGRIPVYWLGLNGSDVQLYREFQPAESGGDPIGEAVLAMTSGKPADPDYFNPWHKASRVTASISGKNVITVDISEDAFTTSMDEGMAHRAVQQLVYTATAAASNAGLTTVGHEASVVLLVDGKADYTAFGHEVLEGPLQRDAALMAPIWIIDPQEGSGSQSSLTVHGTAVSEGGQLSWRVEPIVDGRPAETAIETGYAELEAPTGGSSLFGFTVELPPGEYNVSVFHGEDRENEDSKRVSVSSVPQ